MKVALILLLLWITACTVGPKPIDYGKTACHYCSMSLVDKQHAAQLVTNKGKIFNFDATECALHSLKDFDEKAIAMVLVNDYNNPGALVKVTEATFIISKGIPSPMGAYITAFKTKEEAENAIAQHGGRTFTWEALKNELK